jgi:hypothetical protein
VSAYSCFLVLCKDAVFAHAANGSEVIYPLCMIDQENDENIPLGSRECLCDAKLRDRSVFGVLDGVALLYVGVYVV